MPHATFSTSAAINATTPIATPATTPAKTSVSTPVTTVINTLVGSYTIVEEEDGITVSTEMPWGVEQYRYYFEPKQNCDPREVLPNRSATNVKQFRKPLLGKYRELYYTNKNKLLKESVLAELVLTEVVFD